MLEQVNSLDVGLTGNIWCNDISVALRTARRVRSGYVSVNGTGKRPVGAPFGGFKRSGIGKESALDELLSYGREQTVDGHPPLSGVTCGGPWSPPAGRRPARG